MALERLELKEDTPGHVSSATYLCEASALAYLGETEGKKEGGGERGRETAGQIEGGANR